MCNQFDNVFVIYTFGVYNGQNATFMESSNWIAYWERVELRYRRQFSEHSLNEWKQCFGITINIADMGYLDIQTMIGNSSPHTNFHSRNTPLACRTPNTADDGRRIFKFPLNLFMLPLSRSLARSLTTQPPLAFRPHGRSQSGTLQAREQHVHVYMVPPVLPQQSNSSNIRCSMRFSLPTTAIRDGCVRVSLVHSVCLSGSKQVTNICYIYIHVRIWQQQQPNIKKELIQQKNEKHFDICSSRATSEKKIKENIHADCMQVWNQFECVARDFLFLFFVWTNEQASEWVSEWVFLQTQR